MKYAFKIVLSFGAIGFLFFLTNSCAPFQDSPFSDQLLRSERNLNGMALGRMKPSKFMDDGVLRIAVLSDSHQNYKPLDRVINSINQTPDIDFVANLGDFTNSAYNIEYNQFMDSHTNIGYPTLIAMGNHDAIGAGPSLFRKAFGESNFWFESNDQRFIFFNSANWEDPNNFRPDWLKTAVESSNKPVFIFTHVPLTDTERYHGEVKAIFDGIVASPKVQIVFNGHNHVYLYRTSPEGTILLQAPRVDGNQWLLIEVRGQQLTINRYSPGEVKSATLKP